jgi:hypothetical protein
MQSYLYKIRVFYINIYKILYILYIERLLSDSSSFGTFILHIALFLMRFICIRITIIYQFYILSLKK